jgi:ABC-type glycerol-3-phosphate transport system permease component
MEPIQFLSDTFWAMPSLALATLWWGVGLPMALFLASLGQIPKELYEAADLDSASRWTVLRRITLPAIKRTTVLVLVLQIVAQFQMIGQSQLMTRGGPGRPHAELGAVHLRDGLPRLADRLRGRHGGAALHPDVLVLDAPALAGPAGGLTHGRCGGDDLARVRALHRLGAVLITIGLAILWLAPVVWILSMSFKPNAELMRSTAGFLPSPSRPRTTSTCSGSRRCRAG